MAPLNARLPAGAGAAISAPVGGRVAGASRARDAAGLVLLAAFLLASFGDALRLPFLNDDYVFLDLTRRASFGSLFGLDHLAFGWYRPWSRELHYWLAQRVFGASEPAFHALNLLLGMAVLAAYAMLVRRIAGAAASAWALAAAAALAAWGLPLLWVAGAQDLWMMLWALLALHAWAGERRRLATVAFALALLSKETACVLPAIVFAWDRWLAPRRAARAWSRYVPMAIVTLLWAAIHPHLGGRFWHPIALASAPPEARVAPPLALLRALLILVNLDAWPRPAGTPLELLRAVAFAVVPLVALAWVRWPREAAGERESTSARTPGAGAPPPARVAAFGATWALLGWLPLLLPGLGWHAYYALFGALGALLALSPLLARRRALALASVALVAALGAARAQTPSLDWGEATYQRRAGALLGSMRAALQRVRPSFPPHARLWFAQVPDRVGFLAGDGPALRVWYAEPTLRAGYFSAWRPRAANEPRGEDFFFALDTLAGWLEVRPGAEDVAAARARDPHWEADQVKLAAVLLGGGDWLAAAGVYEKLTAACPDSAVFPYRVALCRSQAGDSTGALRWLARAASHPGATAEIREAARGLGLRSRP